MGFVYRSNMSLVLNDILQILERIDKKLEELLILVKDPPQWDMASGAVDVRPGQILPGWHPKVSGEEGKGGS